MTPLKIAIVGAGPAGCTLARILLQSSLPFDVTVFEGEASANARSQGGTLDLHSDTGLAALRKAGLYDEFLHHARFDGEAIKITDKNLRCYISGSGGNEGDRHGRPEIDRARLRQILVDSLPEGMIAWNHRLRKVDQDMTLHFDHTSVSDFDLLVGADGAWSKVRPLVSSEVPFYSGVGGIRSGIRNAAETHPDIYKLVNRGSLFAFSDNKSLTLQQLGDGTITVTTWGRLPESWSKDLPFDAESDGPALMSHAQEDFKSFDPRMTKALKVADIEPIPMNLYMLPVGHSWTHRPGVTLIGDAQQLMTPFAGEGVNVAIVHAMELADAIIRAAKTLSTSSDKAAEETKEVVLSREIKAFEESMFKRAKEFQQVTFNSMRMMFFEPGGPDAVIEEYVFNMVGHTLHWTIAPLLWVPICTYFWLWRKLGWGKIGLE